MRLLTLLVLALVATAQSTPAAAGVGGWLVPFPYVILLMILAALAGYFLCRRRR
jgi:glycerol uptake facilitator-like aquaporin